MDNSHKGKKTTVKGAHTDAKGDDNSTARRAAQAVQKCRKVLNAAEVSCIVGCNSVADGKKSKARAAWRVPNTGARDRDRRRERDLTLARRAKRAGARYSLRIIKEARRAGLPLSLAFALIEQETDFHNTFGHDDVPCGPQGGIVTRESVRDYLANRSRCGNQGVGLTQLTSPGLQDRAEELGGLHKPIYQLRVGFQYLKGLINQYGLEGGLYHFNGGSDYPPQVLDKQRKWHRILAGR